jgi:hypothetical protein
LTPFDVLIMIGPLLAYGVFYAIREKVSVRHCLSASSASVLASAAAPTVAIIVRVALTRRGLWRLLRCTFVL